MSICADRYVLPSLVWSVLKVAPIVVISQRLEIQFWTLLFYFDVRLSLSVYGPRFLKNDSRHASLFNGLFNLFRSCFKITLGFLLSCYQTFVTSSFLLCFNSPSVLYNTMSQLRSIKYMTCYPSSRVHLCGMWLLLKSAVAIFKQVRVRIEV